MGGRGLSRLSGHQVVARAGDGCRCGGCAYRVAHKSDCRSRLCGDDAQSEEHHFLHCVLAAVHRSACGECFADCDHGGDVCRVGCGECVCLCDAGFGRPARDSAAWREAGGEPDRRRAVDGSGGVCGGLEEGGLRDGWAAPWRTAKSVIASFAADPLRPFWWLHRNGLSPDWLMARKQPSLFSTGCLNPFAAPKGLWRRLWVAESREHLQAVFLNDLK